MRLKDLYKLVSVVAFTRNIHISLTRFLCFFYTTLFKYHQHILALFSLGFKNQCPVVQSVTINLYVNHKQEDRHRRCSGASEILYLMLCTFANSDL